MDDTTPTPAGSDASKLPRLSEERLHVIGGEPGRVVTAGECRSMAHELLAARERIAELERTKAQIANAAWDDEIRAEYAERARDAANARIAELESDVRERDARIAFLQGQARIVVAQPRSAVARLEGLVRGLDAQHRACAEARAAAQAAENAAHDAVMLAEKYLDSAREEARQ